MKSLTLFRPGNAVETAVNLYVAGCGLVLEAVGPRRGSPRYFDTEQDAQEFMIKRAAHYLDKGYRLYTEDGVTE